MRPYSLLLLSCLFISSLSLAQEGYESGFSLPERGTAKAVVESKYGAPNRKTSPVGEPPISRWIYDNFTVVFEYNHVVHAFKRSEIVENVSPSDLPDRPDLSLPPSSESAPTMTLKPALEEIQSTEVVSVPTLENTAPTIEPESTVEETPAKISPPESELKPELY